MDTTQVVILTVMAVLVLGLVGLIAYAFIRIRVGQPLPITLQGYLAIYVRVAMLLALVVLVAGLAEVVNAGLSRLAGAEYSYGREIGTGEAGRLEDAFRAGLVGGIAMALAGGVIYAIHFAASLALGPVAHRRELRLAYLGVLLAVVGVVSILAIPFGISGTIEYAVQTTRQTFHGPGEDLAMAIVFTPVWLGLIALLLREVRRPPS